MGNGGSWFVISRELESADCPQDSIFHLLYFPIFANSIICYTDKKNACNTHGSEQTAVKKQTQISPVINHTAFHADVLRAGVRHAFLSHYLAWEAIFAPKALRY